MLTEVDARVSWLSEEPLRPRARVLLKHGAQTVQAIVRAIEGRLDLDDLTTVPADRLELNDIGLVRLRLASPVPLADYSVSRSDGAFLLIDAHEGGTLAAGMVRLPNPSRQGRSGVRDGSASSCHVHRSPRSLRRNRLLRLLPFLPRCRPCPRSSRSPSPDPDRGGWPW